MSGAGHRPLPRAVTRAVAWLLALLSAAALAGWGWMLAAGTVAAKGRSGRITPVDAHDSPLVFAALMALLLLVALLPAWLAWVVGRKPR